jgi:hypothetical protein
VRAGGRHGGGLGVQNFGSCVADEVPFTFLYIVTDKRRSLLGSLEAPFTSTGLRAMQLSAAAAAITCAKSL